MDNAHEHVLWADWPAPKNVSACSTLRTGGVSCDVFSSLNLGLHVGDAPEAVAENRRRLQTMLGLPGEPRWLNQVHGTEVISAETIQQTPCADSSIVTTPGTVAVVLTADCLPVVLCDRDGRCAAVAHAGWRGLNAGVLERAVEHMHSAGQNILAWLGPAIGPAAFEVGDEVRDAFMASDLNAAAAFVRNERGRWQADIYVLARQRLARVGVTAVYGGGLCTYSDDQRFFSYRRDGVTGRMATMVWLNDDEATARGR